MSWVEVLILVTALVVCGLVLIANIDAIWRDYRMWGRVIPKDMLHNWIGVLCATTLLSIMLLLA